MILACIVSRPRKNVKHPDIKLHAPKYQKIPTLHSETISPAHKYSQDLDTNPRAFYTVYSYTNRSVLMSVAYQQAQKQRYRITLDLSVFGDFDPHQIDWEKLFKLEPAEKCEAYVEDLNTPDRWWVRYTDSVLSNT